MEEKIALGVHACVDWECVWDQEKLSRLAESFQIKDAELHLCRPIRSERDLLLSVLSMMKDGIGGELIPEDERDVKHFAQNFPYRTTMGGTAERAAVALSKLGIRTFLQMSTCNKTLKDLLPEEIRYFPASGTVSEEIHPHVSVTYPKGAEIRTSDIHIVASRENRILFSRDQESMELPVNPDFADEIGSSFRVFLLSCFCEILDSDILRDRVAKSAEMLDRLPPGVLVYYEDGGYILLPHREYVNHALKDRIDILSMNEDELQEYTGKIDLKSPEEVLHSMDSVYRKLEIPTLFVHTAGWAAAYGRNAKRYRSALKSGIAMAAARFEHGDHFGRDEFEKAYSLEPSRANASFASRIESMSGTVCCEPGKNMSFVKHPTVVGLGDFFAGGVLKALAGE